jgi:hypothetical protein
MSHWRDDYERLDTELESPIESEQPVGPRPPPNDRLVTAAAAAQQRQRVDAVEVDPHEPVPATGGSWPEHS